MLCRGIDRLLDCGGVGHVAAKDHRLALLCSQRIREVFSRGRIEMQYREFRPSVARRWQQAAPGSDAPPVTRTTFRA